MSESNYHHGDLKNALIQAGVEILKKEGISGLSLRMVAKQSGVSHAAPYAHFADKQALIAAISTEGFKQLYDQVDHIRKAQQDSPTTLLVETAWAYVQFAFNEPDRFKLMFSSALEKEKEYPDFVQYSQKNFDLFIEVVNICQKEGVLKEGPPSLSAVSLWASVHGLVMLILEGQISHTVLDQNSLKEILLYTLQQVAQTELSSE
ncbi:MAG: TetR/AcrR family transcriptional regulator [Anaerolineales bacterium]|nr:TetR/AcrR family transcriptional regulator [Anaerolineales bacterium]